MAKKSISITFTVFAGYLLLAALAGFAVWFAYDQVVNYTTMTERKNTGNRKLLLVGEAATKLYEAESLSRQLIQTADSAGMQNYYQKIDSIKLTLDALQGYNLDGNLEAEVDSIDVLLNQKAENLKQLVQLRASGETESYYTRVISELRRVDESFEEPNYDKRFRDLQPHQRRLLIKLLEMAKAENKEPASISADSLIVSVRNVLTQLQAQERQYRQELRLQENELLENELKLNSKLRTLFTNIETEERKTSLAQVSNWQRTLEKTSQIIAALGALSLLVIMVFIFLVIRNVASSKRNRNELEKAKNYAETLLKSREQFMNTITHDLRSPLNSVVGYAGLLEKTDLNKSQDRYLNHLKKSSDYLLHLVNDLLDLSKLEAGKMTVDQLAFNPKNLIEETVENAIPPEKPAAVKVNIVLAPELDQSLVTDPFRLKQILTNLVSNACKFTEKGSVTVKGWLDEQRENPVLCIEIKDTGIGISREQKEKVFEEFSQANTTIEKRFGGSGLGLAISRKMTDLLKGTISLESEPGVGSTFLVRIPVKKAKITEDLKPSGESAPKQLDHFSVLIADDEPAQLGLLKEFIRSTGMSFTTARNGKDALEKIRAGKTDLVLTDIQMPEMDGFQLLEHLKKDPELKNIPVIALSGQANISAEAYRKMGFSGSLLKPYSSNQLLRNIEEVLHVEIQKKQQPSSTPEETAKSYTLSEIKTFSGEDQEALNAILRAFIDSTAVNLEALKLAYQKGDFERVSAIAHKMLPMFRQLEVTSPVEKLKVLEFGSKDEKEKFELEEFSEEVDQLLKQLRKEIKD